MIALSIIIPLNSFTFLLANETEKYRFNDGPINYHFERSDSSFIKSLSVPIAKEMNNLEIFFATRLKNSVEIYFPQTDEKFGKLTGDRLPEWSGGVAFTQRRIIVLKPQTFTNKYQIIVTITHELAHIFITDLFDERRIPLWMNEGLATYLSRKSISWNEGLILANAIASKKILALSKIDSLMRLNVASANLAYIEAHTAIAYLINQVGNEKFKDLLTGFSQYSDVNFLFLDKLGYDLEDFEYHWYKNLESRFKWMVVLNFENLFWLLLVVIVVIAFISVKIRNYKKVKKWEYLENSEIAED
jgi:hypothetical protein